MFHPKSPYYKVCADVVLVNPPGVVAEHTHQIEHKPLPTTLPTGDASTLKEISIGKIEFEKQFGFQKQFGKGTDPWYAKANMGKETIPIFFLLGLIEYLKRQWINAKVYNTMKDVDIQVENIKKTWDDDPKPTVIETPSEVEGLNDMSISFSSEEEDPSSTILIRFNFCTGRRFNFLT